MAGSHEAASSGLGAAGFDDLLAELLERVHGAVDEQARWELLLATVVTLGADLSLDRLLGRIVLAAGRLVDAEYAALGVLDEGPRLRTFVHHGMSDEQVVRIGHLPTGHGLLGLLIDRPEPLRLHDIAAHPASYGFPEHHPPMHSFLGVPLRSGDRVLGNLYLTEKAGGADFTEEDERIVVALAAAAGVALENARLMEQAVQRERWLTATAEITTSLARTVTGHDALQAVADQAREVSGAAVAWVVAGPDEEHLSVRVVSGPEVDLDALRHLSLQRSLAREVVRSGTPLAVPEMAADPRATTMRSIPGWPEVGPAMVVPLLHAPGIEGVLALGWLPEDATGYATLRPELPGRFAEHAALALQVVQSREDQQRLALFEDRDRIGRDLHDLVIQRLFAIGLGLQSAARLVDDEAVELRLEQSVDDIDATIKDIRRTIFALGTAAVDADLQTEVERLVDRAAAVLKFRPGVRYEGPVRTLVTGDLAADVLAVLGEALSNVVRHAHAETVEVVLAATGDEVVLTVTDDGTGITGDAPESGLRNLRERGERRGGSSHVASWAGRTTVTWRAPLV